MTDTANLGLPFIEGSQAQKHITHNEALRILDTVIQIAVRDMTHTTPPGVPVEGDRYIVAAAATGAWAGHDDAVATWLDGGWAFVAPKAGWCAWSIADAAIEVYDGAAWRELSPSGGSVGLLGINTIAASPNLFSVKSNAVLFAAIDAADGGTGDTRVQISKETASKTASVVFSNNYSGRAEFGLVGADAFKLKVSADGANWIEALVVDPATGNVALPRGLTLSGVIAPAQITANQNDYAPAGFAAASVMQISADAARSLSGLAGGTEGRVVSIVNVGSQPLQLLDASPASLAANRFALGNDVVIAANRAAILRYDGTAARWQAIARPGGRDVLTADRNFYVRTDGNDSNNGLSNLAGGAFLTIQRAVDVCAATLDFAGFTVTINVGSGTFAAGATLKAMVGMAGPDSLVISGNGPAATIVSTSGDCFRANGPTVQAAVRNLKTETAISGICFAALGGAAINVDNIEFGACAGIAHLLAFGVGSSISVGGTNFAISGGAPTGYFAFASQYAVVDVNALQTVTLSGTPAFAAFAEAENGLVRIGKKTFVGAATGRRFEASQNGLIVSGKSITYLPGDAAGMTQSGGQYI